MGRLNFSTAESSKIGTIQSIDEKLTGWKVGQIVDMSKVTRAEPRILASKDKNPQISSDSPKNFYAEVEN